MLGQGVGDGPTGGGVFLTSVAPSVGVALGGTAEGTGVWLGGTVVLVGGLAVDVGNAGTAVAGACVVASPTAGAGVVGTGVGVNTTVTITVTGTPVGGGPN